MSPETVVWILHQMILIQARVGSRVLSRMPDRGYPQETLMALRRLSTPRAREVAQFLENPLEAPRLFDHAPATAGALMATEVPKVCLGDQNVGFPIRSKNCDTRGP